MWRAGVAVLAMALWAGLSAVPASAQAGDVADGPAREPSSGPSSEPSSAGPASASTQDTAEALTILSVDASTLPGTPKIAGRDTAPAWRTSFGSERRSEPSRTRPESAVDADIVLLQGVRDVRTLRLWFPAKSWKLVVSRQMLMSEDPLDRWARDGIAPVPTTAVAVRYQPGLRVTAQDHLLDLANLGQAIDGTPGAAATAVRVLIDGRETWAISVLLPRQCVSEPDAACPARDRLMAWHTERARDGVRRVTGGRFAPLAATESGDQNACQHYGLRLDPVPPPPKRQHTAAEPGSPLGCMAAVAVAK